MNKKPPPNDLVIVIDNPSKLPLLPLDDFRSFQGDFKGELEPDKLDKLMRSILDHHVFIAKVKNQPPDLTAGEFNRSE